MVYSDNEVALMAALRNVLPDTVISTCRFHIKQLLHRHLKQNGCCKKDTPTFVHSVQNNIYGLMLFDLNDPFIYGSIMRYLENTIEYAGGEGIFPTQNASFPAHS